MREFDKEEQHIRQAMNGIKVDSGGLVQQVKLRLDEPVPIAKMYRMARRPLALAVIVSLLLVASVAAAELGTFNWFMERFHPAFEEIMEPVESYAVDQGIRMEVIGAQKYENQAVVYLSLQDITGENRLTEKTDFRDGFSLRINTQPEAEGKETVGGYGYKNTLLHFDEQTNTAYYEFNITVNTVSPWADPFTIGSFLIYFDETNYEDAPVLLNFSELPVPEPQILTEDYIFGMTNKPEDFGGLVKILKPGYYEPMPHGFDDQWISAIGFVNGGLHIQIGTEWGKEFGSNDPSFMLLNANGTKVYSNYDLKLIGDEKGNLFSLDEGYEKGVCKYTEFVFDITQDELDNYTLCYTGTHYTGVEGSWRVAVNTGDNSQQTRIWTNDIYVDGLLFEHLTLTPLGLQAFGRYNSEKDDIMVDIQIEIETQQGFVLLEGGGGSWHSEKQTFIYQWKTKAPLDVPAVKAVLINGVRLDVQ